MQPNETDWKIINLLSEKYLTNTEIAKIIGLSEGAVRQRIKRLQENNILKVCGLRDPNLLENQQMATIMANVEKSSMLTQKAREISELENVLSVSITSGRYDLFIDVLVDSNKGLVHFLTESLSKVSGIARTETFLTLKSYNKWV